MVSEGKNINQHDISPVLFMTVEGEPMSFYLRPGPVKRKLHPLIRAGGGIMCQVQTPGSILLIDPKEKGTLSQSTAHQYVSIQYIHDCVGKAEQLNLDDYRVEANKDPVCSLTIKSSYTLKGRHAYSPAEDAAILKYISRRKSESKGNSVWQQMEKEHVTTHSWQSMKAHYKNILTRKLLEDNGAAGEEDGAASEDAGEDGVAAGEDGVAAGEGGVAAGEGGGAGGEDGGAATGNDKEAGAATGDDGAAAGDDGAAAGDDGAAGEDAVAAGEDAVAAGEDAVAAGEDAVAAGEDAVAAAVDAVAAAVDAVAAAGHAEAAAGDAEDNNEMSDSPSCVKDAAPHTEPKGPPETNSADDLTLIDLIFAAEKGPSAHVQAQVSSPVHQEKILSPLKDKTTQEATAKDQTCESSQATENMEQQTEQQQVNTLPQTEKAPEDTEPTLLKPRSDVSTSDRELEGQMLRTSRRNLELRLVMDSEEEEEEPYTRKLRSASAATCVRPVSSSPTSKRTSSAVLSLQEKTREEEPPSKRAKETSLAQDEEAANAEDADQRPATPLTTSSPISQLSQSKLGQGERKKTQIEKILREFSSSGESESGEEIFQTPCETLVSADTSPARPDERHDEQECSGSESPTMGPSRTSRSASLHELGGEFEEEDATLQERAQVDEDMQCIRNLMKQTNQDLISVTKALLKTSGDVSAASRLLSHPTSFNSPFWDRRDDDVLLSADPGPLKQLLEKHGQAGVSKRRIFLNVER
nr:telomeric repeat-binding factor 2-interacting protein 1-like [Nerophis lumbriciformis]